MIQSKVSATLIDTGKIEIEIKGSYENICYLMESLISNMLKSGFPGILIRAAVLNGIEKYEDSKKGKMQDGDKILKDIIDTLSERLANQYDKS